MNHVRKFGEPMRTELSDLAHKIIDTYHTQGADIGDKTYEEIRSKLSAREQLALSEEISEIRASSPDTTKFAKAPEVSRKPYHPRAENNQIEKPGDPHVRRKISQRNIVWFGIILGLLMLIVCGSIADRRGEESVRARLTPIERARFDWGMEHRQRALEDLKTIPSSSSDYDEALALIAKYQQEIENDKPAKMSTAEEACQNIVKTTEEFPSTVSMGFFPKDPIVNRESRTIRVEVEYTAKNSLGAELPYKMTCTTDFDGNVEDYSRTGR
jgi:hypothetical protein